MGERANVRLREINGKGVGGVLPQDVVIAAGVTRMGLVAWSGVGPSMAQVAICVVFDALPGRRYTVAVAGFRKDWAVSLASSGGEKVVPIFVTPQAYNENALPCEGANR